MNTEDETRERLRGIARRVLEEMPTWLGFTAD